MELERFEERLGYAFNDRELLREALTHTTYVNEHRDETARDNQRLEFLGDTVINSIITARLFHLFPDEKEGPLTKKRAELISEGALSRIARHLGIGSYLFLGKGEELDGGRRKASLLADAYEAVVGAMFLDSSYEETARVVHRHFAEAFGAFETLSTTDYKSLLLEFCQSRFKALPRIAVVHERGPEHEKEFEVGVILEGSVIGHGTGKNKKQAAQEACKEALRSLGYPL
ncbi:MAG TPA: ribonuclease III [Deltaproteobacteria bacterium]|nr:ribonuclease III [Deltaproteobacteria bacterium]HQI80179.1 ribonuclease III [Deltaproteobacteria bacterium]